MPRDTLELCLAEFEANWQPGESGGTRRILSYLPSERGASGAALDLAIELAAVDMELQWRASATTTEQYRPTTTDYLALFGPRQLSRNLLQTLRLELLVEEFRVRQLWGDKPTLTMFLALAAEDVNIATFASRLQEVQAELRADEEPVARVARVAPVAPVAKSASLEAARWQPSTQLAWSDFVLQELIGRGGFGKVYRATCKRTGQFVAIKSLHKSRQKDPRSVEQFLRESQVLGAMSHPCIVSMQGIGQYPGGGYFLVMQLVDGEDLQAKIRHGSVNTRHVLPVGIDLARGAAHAHAVGVIHGDLKPGNVLISNSGNALIADFGLASLQSPSDRVDQRVAAAGGTQRG